MDDDGYEIRESILGYQTIGDWPNVVATNHHNILIEGWIREDGQQGMSYRMRGMPLREFLDLLIESVATIQRDIAAQEARGD